MPEYKTHSFNKDWHDKVKRFLEENDNLAFDSPKYFIKYCVNRYMDEFSDSAKSPDVEYLEKLFSKIRENSENSDDFDFQELKRAINEVGLDE